MKKYFVIALLVLFGVAGNAQVQEKIEQILKLQVYIRQLEQGYAIVQKGLKVIGDIKSGHLSLDNDFFASLEMINPAIEGYGKVADIATMKQAVMEGDAAAAKKIKESGLFSLAELAYFKAVYSKLEGGCADISIEIDRVLMPSLLKMADDARIRQIDRLYELMREHYEFARSFSNDLHIQMLQRSRRRQEAATLRILLSN